MPQRGRENDSTSNEGQPGGGATTLQKRKVTRVPTYRALPSERFGWEAHIAVLKNLVLRSRFGEQPVDTDVIEEGLRTQSASLNVNFLAEAGLAIKEKRKYRPTPECVQFVRLYSVDESRARQVLRSVLEKTWFANVAMHTLELAGSASEDQLIKELAVDAGVVEVAPKERSLRVLLEYLVYSGLLTREGNQLTWARESTGPSGLQPSPQPANANPVYAQAQGQYASSAGQGPMSQGPRNQAWVHRNWPGHFDLWIRPDPAALRLLKNALAEFEKSLGMSENAEESQ